MPVGDRRTSGRPGSGGGSDAAGASGAGGRWTCPRCDREFGRTRQSHFCLPGSTVDATFTGRSPVQREICETIIGYVATLGPVHVDAVRVGVFLKRDRTLAELRPMVRSLTVWLVLPHPVEHPRITRRVPISATRVAHVIKLSSPDEVDDQLRDWLAEAYLAAGA